MILVAGATGMVGGEACRVLRGEGQRVRALVRATSKEEKVAALRALGCEVVAGDLNDAGSLARACAGVTGVVSTVSSMPFSWSPPSNTIDTVDRDGQRRLIDAAQQAGVRRFTVVTFSGNIDQAFPLRDAKRAVEKHLRESGTEWTILRPSFFSEVWLSPAVGFDARAGQATIYGTGENPISWISFLDVARFAAASVSSAAARNAVLELGGPEPLTPLQVVRIFEQASGRPFRVQHVPVEALQQQLAGAPDDMLRSFTALMLAYAAGDPIDMHATQASFGIALRTVSEYARGVLATAPAQG
ncbi:MAG TPA: SDR family oxidoreductase [Longimicrobiales bacterium]